ncbi:MAG: TM2 domain-containing protein [Muribaculaceae bacterium]|nr:TM2 domain-containing protein [Muribaculaceae bacterium]
MPTLNCPSCNQQFTTPFETPQVQCPHCGAVVNNPAAPQAQAAPQYAQPAAAQGSPFDAGPSGKSRGIFGLLAILVGCFGVHYFYVGKVMPGVVFLLAFLLGFLLCGIPSMLVGVCSLVQGIMAFVKTQEQFEQTYVNTPKSFPLF